MKKKILLCCLAGVSLCLTGSAVFASAAKTDHPVVFAHGMMGFDQILGIDYFGNDYGVFVGEPCDGYMEVSCNVNIDKNQKAFAAEVSPFQSSEYRGLQLADEIEGYMATVGAGAVNIVGHSQGGLDARKAAKLLYDRKGQQVVKVLVSLSSPHRGAAVAGNILPKVESVFYGFVRWLADNIVNPLFYVGKGDYLASMKSLYYDDWDPDDKEVTGVKAFNSNYPMDNTYIKYYGSLITMVQYGLNPLILGMGLFAPMDIDGDGWCGTTDENGDLLDCQGDGAAGDGDGEFEDADDDGLVGLNSQQMGFRLTYAANPWNDTHFIENWAQGYVGNLNHPNVIQSTSHGSALRQDHLDVCGLGIIPYLISDAFDELQFYADLIDYIAYRE